MSDTVQPPECPHGCGCRWREDADRYDCACDGPCCLDGWNNLPNGTQRPDPADNPYDDEEEEDAAPVVSGRPSRVDAAAVDFAAVMAEHALQP